jgi:hypothetical protein
VISENPLFLVLRNSPEDFADLEKLPVDIYETVVTVTSGNTTYSFKPVSYKVETTEAERIAVD